MRLVALSMLPADSSLRFTIDLLLNNGLREPVMAQGQNERLFELLGPERLTAVVDIGANPIGSAPPYKNMLTQGLCTLIGFEPQPEVLAKLDRTKGPHEQYLPYAIGDGRERVLHVCAASGMTSLMEPDRERLALFNDFRLLGLVESKRRVTTRRLDEVQEVDHLDLLKIDVQGGELDVFKGARRLLRRAVAVHTEVSFIPLYRDQPPFGTVDTFLRTMGFVPHCFTNVMRWPLAPMVIGGNRRQPVHQLLEADIVYVRDFTHCENMDAEQWKHLALVAHYCYRSIDLVLRAITSAIKLGALAPTSPERYLKILGSMQIPTSVTIE
jgi:FkbM family methyltransferase